jgi:hypothetical protein
MELETLQNGADLIDSPRVLHEVAMDIAGCEQRLPLAPEPLGDATGVW